MKKDAYYFPHFSNARNDAKLLKLRRVLGLEGYGIFFCLLEILRNQTDFKYPLENLAELEYELRISKEKISTVIMDYDLFTVDSESKFFSPKMILYLQPYIEKSELQREKALKRWRKVGNDAAALPRDSHGNASKVNQTKPNETELKENVQFFGSGDSDFILIPPKYASDKWKKIIGGAGLNEFYHANMSSIKNPELTEKFLREKCGSHFEDFKHVHNTFIKFSTPNGNGKPNTNSAEVIIGKKQFAGKL